MIRGLIGVCAVLLAFQPAMAMADHELSAKFVCRFIDDQTVGVVRLDLDRLDVAAALTWLAEIGLLNQADITEPKHMAGTLVNGLKLAGVHDTYLVFNLVDVANGPLVVFPVTEKTKVEAIAAVCDLIPLEAHAQLNGAVVAGRRSTVERAKRLKNHERPELLPAFTAAGDSAVQALLIPTDGVKKGIELLIPNLPREIGGGPTTRLTSGFVWGAIGVDLPPKPAARITVQALDAQHAVDLGALWGETLGKFVELDFVKRTIPARQELLPSLKPKIQSNQLRLTIDTSTPGIERFLKALAVRAKDAAAEQRTRDNLRQLGLAMHNSASEKTAAFPEPAIVDGQGRALLSWRVAVLPYLGQEELFKQFRLNEPWDSEHNRRLINRMPEVFSSSLIDPQSGLTTYLAVVGPGYILDPKLPVKLSSVTDGLSSTVLLVDVVPEHAVPWTKPQDWAPDQEDPFKKLVRPGQAEFTVLMADGTPRRLSTADGLERFRALLTRAGGEIIKE